MAGGVVSTLVPGPAGAQSVLMIKDTDTTTIDTLTTDGEVLHATGGKPLQGRKVRTLVKVALCGLLFWSSPLTTVEAAEPRPFGDAKVLAQVPTPPGFPEGIAVQGNRVYVAGPATFGTTGKPRSRVVAFSTLTGAQVASYETKGENVLAEHANSSIAFDGSGRLYVLNTQLGMYRLTPATGKQEPYGDPFPDLPPCVLSPAPCSPAPSPTPPLPNDVAFDDAGNAYVTDALQATIWRVPVGGGAPQIWFQDSRLASAYIGVNGIRLDPTRTNVVITVTADLVGQSFVYTLPLVDNPAAADLAVFHHYGPGELPDGVAFGASGLLYVAIATPGASGVSVLAPNGEEKARLANPLGSPVKPYDSPANIAFNGKGSILLSNHAFVTGVVDPSAFNVLDVFVGDTASPLAKPIVP